MLLNEQRYGINFNEFRLIIPDSDVNVETQQMSTLRN